MSEINKELFKTLAELEAQKKGLEAQIKVARTAVEEEMEKLETDKVNSDYGSFYFATTKRYKYSDSVTEKEAEIKTLKKKEEEDGVAELQESKSLRFRAK